MVWKVRLPLASTACSLIVSGTPAAVPVMPLKLLRISLRTTPSWVSTFTTPLLLLLVPSPGYGPPVSSGITLQEPLVGVVLVPGVVVVVPVVVLVDVVPVDVLAVLVSELLPPPHPASGSAATPAPASSQRRVWRRPLLASSIVAKSSARLWPCAWSCDFMAY